MWWCLSKSIELHLTNHSPNSIWPGLCLTQLCSFTSHAQTLFTLHSFQRSNWHIVSQFTSYSVEYDTLMGLHHRRFIWINTQIPPVSGICINTHKPHVVIIQEHSPCAQISHVYRDAFFVPSVCFTVHVVAVLWWLANGVVIAMIFRSKQNRLVNGRWLMMTFKLN